MFSLVNVEEPTLLTKSKMLKMNWVRLPDEEPPVTEQAKPEPPVKVDMPPEIPKEDITADIQPSGDTVWIEPRFERGTGALHKIADSQLVLALGYPPSYPQNQANRGVEGYVVVGFSVSASGQVYDSFIIESEPKGVFDRSALQAIAKFKYKARVVNDKPVSTDGQRYLFRYELND